MEPSLPQHTTSLAIQTIITRDYDKPDLMSFEVQCLDGEGVTAGSLEGFVLDLGYFPDLDELDDVFFLDGRSAHALQAFEVLAANKGAVEQMLPSTEATTFIHLEEARVAKPYRGRGLALRLMREARFALHGYGRIVTLKAHPLEGEANAATQTKLANYYETDNRLGFQPINAVEHPGWLVAAWDERVTAGGDGPMWR